MSLQGKFTAVFAFAALVPILGAARLVRWTVRRIHHDAAARVLDDARRSGESQFRQLAHNVEDAVSTRVLDDDHDVRAVLLERAKGTFNEEQQAELADRALAMMRARRLDVLTILDPRGRILACGHVPGRVGELEPEAAVRAAKFPGNPLLVPEQVLENDGGLVSTLALEGARTVRSHGEELIIVAGRRLDRGFLEALHQHGRLEARLVAPDGTEIAALSEGW